MAIQDMISGGITTAKAAGKLAAMRSQLYAYAYVGRTRRWSLRNELVDASAQSQLTIW